MRSYSLNWRKHKCCKRSFEVVIWKIRARKQAHALSQHGELPPSLRAHISAATYIIYFYSNDSLVCSKLKVCKNIGLSAKLAQQTCNIKTLLPFPVGWREVRKQCTKSVEVMCKTQPTNATWIQDANHSHLDSNKHNLTKIKKTEPAKHDTVASTNVHNPPVTSSQQQFRTRRNIRAERNHLRLLYSEYYQSQLIDNISTHIQFPAVCSSRRRCIRKYYIFQYNKPIKLKATKVL